MTEPVAYRVDGTFYNNLHDAEYAVREINHLRNTLKIDNGLIPKIVYIEPLYEEEQLHPRVKMTQAEFEEWKELYYRLVELTFTAYQMLNEILNSTHNSSGKYIELSKRVYRENNFMSVSKKQAELTNLFINYSPDKPEETIEIVPDMKWFVRSKTKENGHYQVMAESRVSDMPRYTIFKSYAMTFDTKEEAELWTNPLTEAVQLPVEGE